MIEFNDSVIKFESAQRTPFAELLSVVPSERWDALLGVVVTDFKQYAQENSLGSTRNTWEKYKKVTDWQVLADKASKEVQPKLSFFSKLFA